MYLKEKQIINKKDSTRKKPKYLKNVLPIKEKQSIMLQKYYEIVTSILKVYYNCVNSIDI